jgi:hypothetical protein
MCKTNKLIVEDLSYTESPDDNMQIYQYPHSMTHQERYELHKSRFIVSDTYPNQDFLVYDDMGDNNVTNTPQLSNTYPNQDFLVYDDMFVDFSKAVH